MRYHSPSFLINQLSLTASYLSDPFSRVLLVHLTILHKLNMASRESPEHKRVKRVLEVSRLCFATGLLSRDLLAQDANKEVATTQGYIRNLEANIERLQNSIPKAQAKPWAHTEGTPDFKQLKFALESLKSRRQDLAEENRKLQVHINTANAAQERLNNRSFT